MERAGLCFFKHSWGSRVQSSHQTSGGCSGQGQQKLDPPGPLGEEGEPGPQTVHGRGGRKAEGGREKVELPAAGEKKRKALEKKGSVVGGSHF